MTETNFFRRNRLKIILALALTFASGLVDIVGYVGIYHFFTAHVTGTTVELAHNAIQKNWSDALPAGIVLLAFFFGSVFGRTLIHVGARTGVRRMASITLSIEAALIVATAYFAAVSAGSAGATANGPIRNLFLGLLAAAMGLQTATLTGVGPLTVHTTFVTGMVNKLAQLISRIGFHTYDIMRLGAAERIRGERKQDEEKAGFVFAIWLLYLGGAGTGSLLFRNWGLKTLYVAAVLLLVGVGMDQVVPLSVQEEKEESES